MKKYLYFAAALVMGMSVFTSCSKDENEPEKEIITKTLDFEGTSFTALIDKQNNGPLLYGDGGESPVKYSWSDAGNTNLTSSLTVTDWGNGYYGFAEGGIAISNYIDTNILDHATPDYQLSVPKSNGSKNFAVSYDKSTMLFSDRKARKIRSIDVSPTTYELGVITFGNDYASPIGSGNLTIIVTGYNGSTKTGSVNIDLARKGEILKEWNTVDLSKLGMVTSIVFTMDGSDKNKDGYLNSPAYFAFDNVVVEM